MEPQDMPTSEIPVVPPQGVFRNRKLLLGTGIVGAVLLVVGALWYAGVFTLIFSRAPAAELAPVLTAQCVAGNTNRINLSWTVPPNASISSIERSVDDGGWDTLWMDSSYPLAGATFSDARMITFGRTYKYRVIADGTTPSGVITVQASAAICR